MSTNSQSLPKFWKITFAALIVLFVLPLLYIVIYRPADYYLCRGFVSMKLGKGFSPDAIDDYVRETLIPGMPKNQVIEKLDEIGRVKINYIGYRMYQINVQICTDPFNRMIVFARFGDGGRLISTEIDSD